MMTFWIMFDLGVKGDYQNAYRWLDNHKAVECGNDLAAVPDYSYAEDFLKELTADLSSSINIEKKDKIYVIYKNESGQPVGKFIFGNRRFPRWAGCGDLNTPETDY